MAQPQIEFMVGPEAASRAKPTAQLDTLEVTQAIQDLNATVPLIAEKRTFVRAYLGQPSGVVKVRGELLVAHKKSGPWTTVTSFGTAELDASRSGSTLAQLRSRRENLAYSLDFRLPEKFTEEGTFWLRLGKVRDAANGVTVQVSDPVGARTATFLEGPELRLRVINLRYATGTPPVQHAASKSDLEHLESWLARAYPIEEVDFSSVTVAATATWQFTALQANAQVAAIRALDMAAGGDPGTHYYGLVSDGGGFMRGQASAIPAIPDPSAVASGPTGVFQPWSGFGWDTDGSYGDWYGGHELAHTLGRLHPGFCNNNSSDDPAYPFANGQLSNADGRFTGIDVGDADLGIPAAALPGTTWHDVMTYCDNQWLSSYAYVGIRDRLLAEEALFPDEKDDSGLGSSQDAEAPVHAGPVHVVAVVNLTNRSAELAYVTPLPGSPVLPRVPVDSRLALRIQLRDESSRVEPVVFKPNACRHAGEDETGLVDTVVAIEFDAAAIELLLDGEPVATFRAGGEPGTAQDLRVERPETGAAAGDAPGTNGQGPILTWTNPSGADGGGRADGTEPRYAVQASTDFGQTWTTLAVGTTDTSVSLDPDQFAEADRVRFRVLTSTGFSQTLATTEDLPAQDL